MVFDELRLSVECCGGQQPDDELDRLNQKLAFLEGTARYGGLLANIRSANDRNNFHAYVMEATFAYQFESNGIHLKHEVRQTTDVSGSIDFMLRTSKGNSIYLELRLLQLDKETQKEIDQQLDGSDFYRIERDSVQKAILRAQNVLLGKVQKAKGMPTKFARAGLPDLNIITIDVSKAFLDGFDVGDFEQVMNGYHSDNEILGTFGMFQEPRLDDSPRVRKLGARYKHFRAIVSGVLFLRQTGGAGTRVLDYHLHGCTIWNRTVPDETRVEANAEIARAIPALTI